MSIHTQAHLSPEIQGESAARRWEREAHNYNMLHVRLRLIRDEVLRLAPVSVLELGCGTGVLRGELLAGLPHLKYFGCDVSESAVAALGDPNVVRVDLNSEPPPFAGQRFECVVASGTLEYICDLPGLLSALRERTTAGGGLVVSYFNMRHVWRRLQQLRGRVPHRHPTWVNDYSLREFGGLLRAAGYSILRRIPSNLGLRGSPSVGQERWSAPALRRLRGLPLVGLFAHQMVFVCRA